MTNSFRVFSTPLDPVEEPPGGVDPLGTLGGAERLAEVLLPGFTVRMWRARLLTFSALAAEVSERVVRKMNGRAEVRLEARLALERLFVTALSCTAEGEEAAEGRTSTRIPGNRLAKAAWAAKLPLTRTNFLEGPAVNGPFGVMARLARNLDLVDAEGRPGPKSPEMLLAWAHGTELEGVLGEEGEDRRAGALWMEAVVKAVVEVVSKGGWPGRGQGIWGRLSAPLQPKAISPDERKLLGKLLDGAPVRRRVFELIRPAVRDYLRARSAGGDAARGKAERAVLWERLHADARNGDGLDRGIAAVTQAIEAFETAAARFLEGFDAVRWGLVRRGGRATQSEMLSIPQVATAMSELTRQMGDTVLRLDAASERLGRTGLSDVQLTEPLDRLRLEAAEAVSPEALVHVILSRHELVQRRKGKGTWVDRSSGPRWLLMPGFGVGGDNPPRYRDTWIHPFRIGNAYSILADLGRVRFEDNDGEE